MPTTIVNTDNDVKVDMTTLTTNPAAFPQTYFKSKLEIQRQALKINPAVTAIQTTNTVISAAATAALA